MSELLQIFLLALLGSIVALIGGVAFLFKESWSDFLERHSVPFAAGVLLTVSLLGLLPEAVHMIGEQAFVVTLLAFVSAYLFETVFFEVHHHPHKHAKSYESAIPLVIVGDTIHNLIDGVAIATSYLVNPGLGLVTALSTFLHEVPHEISDFGILLRAGWKKRSILLVNIISALMTIAGAFIVVFVLKDSSQIGILLAVSAGLFLYLGASDFLPHIHENEHHKPIVSILSFLVGIAIMFVALNAIPHTHKENELDSDHEYSQEDLLENKINNK